MQRSKFKSRWNLTRSLVFIVRFDSRPIQIALLLAFLRLKPGPKQYKRLSTASPSGNEIPVSRLTGADTLQYINEELVTTLFRGRVESRKGVARRLLHGDLLSPWGHGCCEERQDLSFVA